MTIYEWSISSSKTTSPLDCNNPHCNLVYLLFMHQVNVRLSWTSAVQSWGNWKSQVLPIIFVHLRLCIHTEAFEPSHPPSCNLQPSMLHAKRREKSSNSTTRTVRRWVNVEGANYTGLPLQLARRQKVLTPPQTLHTTQGLSRAKGASLSSSWMK